MTARTTCRMRRRSHGFPQTAVEKRPRLWTLVPIQVAKRANRGDFSHRTVDRVWKNLGTATRRSAAAIRPATPSPRLGKWPAAEPGGRPTHPAGEPGRPRPTVRLLRPRPGSGSRPAACRLRPRRVRHRPRVGSPAGRSTRVRRVAGARRSGRCRAQHSGVTGCRRTADQRRVDGLGDPAAAAQRHAARSAGRRTGPGRGQQTGHHRSCRAQLEAWWTVGSGQPGAAGHLRLTPFRHVEPQIRHCALTDTWGRLIWGPATGRAKVAQQRNQHASCRHSVRPVG